MIVLVLFLPGIGTINTIHGILTSLQQGYGVPLLEIKDPIGPSPVENGKRIA